MISNNIKYVKCINIVNPFKEGRIYKYRFNTDDKLYYVYNNEISYSYTRVEFIYFFKKYKIRTYGC